MTLNSTTKLALSREREREMGMEVLKDSLPFAAMVTLEIGEIGLITLSKAAMSSGLNSLVYCVYYNALGTFFLFPFFIFHTITPRRSRGPPLSLSLVAKFFLLGLLGICVVQIFSNLGIRYSSPTLAAALGNLIPGFTFLLAVIFRMEKLSMRSSTNVAKIVGTIVSISGAFIVTFYKGPPIYMAPSPATTPRQLSLYQKSNWVLGGLLLAITCLSSSSWNVVQAVIIKEYPEKMTLIFYSCLFGTIQCAVISLIVESNLSAWKLDSGIQVIAVLYAAICGTVLRSSIFPWCLEKKGPVFVALFKPLGTAIAVVMGVIFLGETPHVGSMIGALVITLGFYAVMWGQAKQSNILAGKSNILESATQKTPLLQST